MYIILYVQWINTTISTDHCLFMSLHSDSTNSLVVLEIASVSDNYNTQSLKL